MRMSPATTSGEVREVLFTLGDISGVLWLPAGAAGPRPLLLLAYGGGQHKKAPGLVAQAERFVAACGFAAAAIDAPGSGDRPRSAPDDQLLAAVRARAAAGEPAGPAFASYNAGLARRAVPEWQATLTALGELDEVGPDHPAGFWGMSQGAGVGVALAAVEPRIKAAVFGLAGQESLAAAAALVTVPVEFVLQWDDQLIARESGLALFDAFGSAEKTLHANPGGHGDIPPFERESSMRFFARHLRAESSRPGT